MVKAWTDSGNTVGHSIVCYQCTGIITRSNIWVEITVVISCRYQCVDISCKGLSSGKMDCCQILCDRLDHSMDKHHIVWQASRILTSFLMNHALIIPLSALAGVRRKQHAVAGVFLHSLRFLVEDKRIKLYAFVTIMTDHIHLIWQNAAPDSCLPAANRYLNFLLFHKELLLVKATHIPTRQFLIQAGHHFFFLGSLPFVPAISLLQAGLVAVWEVCWF